MESASDVISSIVHRGGWRRTPGIAGEVIKAKANALNAKYAKEKQDTQRKAKAEAGGDFASPDEDFCV